ncbi:cis-3-hydroxy-L-proline dehydratase [Chromohalobacter israelensis]|uniref:cis-3-hydroxy-L-proline dehydratase n=1 Tax=Chromohalobacter israelensis TaxID=141390 RepID=UPI00265C02BA|nr:aconitase family protein [Chromohalobacter salexigens]MDO0944430.1 aconitase family protein [Chromohalobacter salexigens]
MSRRVMAGDADASLLASREGLSFWGGVDAATGEVIDSHHPLKGQTLGGKILAMPTSRGSCTGSGILLELIMNGNAPAALVFSEPESILTLGVLVAQHLFEQSIPVIQLDPEPFARLCRCERARIDSERLVADELDVALVPLSSEALTLTSHDRALLAGHEGEAAQRAMRILHDMAVIEGASHLIDVSRVHIDGCIYASPALLSFAEIFADLGARVKVPTTMNSISVDHSHWRGQGVPEAFGFPASRLADTYIEMGARPSFTCAPYLLQNAPAANEVIAWSESNAVIYANSVLGARTAKHPDLLDLCIALTGRAPCHGVYLDEERRARRIIDVDIPPRHDDALWSLLGYRVGQLAPDCVPLVTGIDALAPSDDDLKALCAAFGTTSAAPMLHIEGITPEASCIDPSADRAAITGVDLADVWQQFNAGAIDIDLVAFGSPHFSLAECRKLAELMAGRCCHPAVTGIVTLGRDTLKAAREEGSAQSLEAAGLRLHPDLCWCSISEPVFPPAARTLMTNSGKYAHYAPGLSGRAVRFGSLSECVTALVTGRTTGTLPDWLRQPPGRPPESDDSTTQG